MFHRVMVLSEGKVSSMTNTYITHCIAIPQVAYHGVPEKAYEVFVNALQSTFLSQGVDIPPLEDHNPAGIYVYSTVYYNNVSVKHTILTCRCDHGHACGPEDEEDCLQLL